MPRKSRPVELEEQGLISFMRQTDMHDPSKKDIAITMVGCGGIGSSTALSLTKFGVSTITLIDMDTVEIHNIPNQLFMLKQVGQTKAGALKALVEVFGGAKATAIVKPVQEVADVLHGTVVTGLDSMQARHDVWALVKKNPKVKYLIDGRLGPGPNIVVWSIDVHSDEDIEMYEQFAMYTDDEADEAPCTNRANIYIANYVAGKITEQVAVLARDEKPERMHSYTPGKNHIWTSEDEVEELVNA